MKMIIITKRYSFIHDKTLEHTHGPFTINKKDFLALKMKYQNSGTNTPMDFLKQNTKLKAEEIVKLARFLIVSNFRIEE